MATEQEFEKQYEGAQLLAKEVKSEDKRIREAIRGGELTTAEAVAAELSDTVMSLMTDMAERLATALQPRDDGYDDDEEEGEVVVGLEPEQAELIVRLLSEYLETLIAMGAAQPPPSEDVAMKLKDRQAEIKATIELVKSLQLEDEGDESSSDDDDEDEDKSN